MDLAASSLAFNSDATVLAVGHATGFILLNAGPDGVREALRRDLGGAVAACELRGRTNLVALAGGGAQPFAPASKVLLWDDAQQRAVGELAFRSPVRAVRLREERIAVATEHKVFLYALASLRPLAVWDTFPNAAGLLALSTQPGPCVLLCPGPRRGLARVQRYDALPAAGGLVPVASALLTAHASDLAAVALSPCGSRAATASEKGTLVRLWDTASGAQVGELRRGADVARVFSLALSGGAGGGWLAAASDKGTVHLWPLPDGAAGGATAGATRPLPRRGGGGEGASGSSPPAGLARGLLPRYFSSTWSTHQLRLPPTAGGPAGASPGARAAAPRALVAFGPGERLLLVATSNGCFSAATWATGAPGECRLLAAGRFGRAAEGGVEAAETR